MSEIRINTKNLLNDLQAELAVSNLIYSVEDITSCFYDKTNSDIVLTGVPEEKSTEIKLVVSEIVEMAKNIRLTKPRTRTDLTDCELQVGLNDFDKVFNKQSPPTSFHIQLERVLDQALSKLVDNFHVQRRKYNSLISRKTMEKCNYIKTFPQNLFLVAEIPHQKSILDNFKANDVSLETIVRLSDNVLTPAVCFHSYEEYQDQVVESPIILEANAKCFRHEAPWRVGGHRLQEFTMKEYVIFGDEVFVKKARDFLKAKTWDLFLKLGLNGYIETAYDPFYYPDDLNKIPYQLMSEMKQELVVQFVDDKKFAIASFNYMGNIICEKFNITNSNGGWLHSGCVAFGIDRWKCALLNNYGDDLEKWPSHVKNELSLFEPEEVSQ